MCALVPDLVAEVELEPAHDGHHHDQGHDAHGDARRGDDGDDGQRPDPPLGPQIAQADEELVGKDAAIR